MIVCHCMNFFSPTNVIIFNQCSMHFPTTQTPYFLIYTIRLHFKHSMNQIVYNLSIWTTIDGIEGNSEDEKHLCSHENQLNCVCSTSRIS